MPIKTYVLLESMNADAPVYQRVTGDQRVKVTKMPYWAPYLRITFQDENGMSKTIRYKENAVLDGKSVLDQRDQIDKLKIDANEPFTQNERRDRLFKNGVLTTQKTVLQDYLEIYPAMEGFKGTCDDVRDAVYKLMDKTLEGKIKNKEIKLRVQAANRILSLNHEEASAMMIRLNGSYVKAPDELEDCQNMLMEFADDSDEAGLIAILKKDEDVTVDETTRITIGLLMTAGLLKFDATNGVISKKRGNDFVELRVISTEYDVLERERLFCDFLNSKEGMSLKNDLEGDLIKYNEAQTKKAEKQKK